MMSESPLRGLRMPDLEQKINLKKSTIYADPTFPRPCRIGGASVWIEGEVDEWLRQRMAQRDQLMLQRIEKAKKAADASVDVRIATGKLERTAEEVAAASARVADRRAKKAAKLEAKKAAKLEAKKAAKLEAKKAVATPATPPAPARRRKVA